MNTALTTPPETDPTKVAVTFIRALEELSQPLGPRPSLASGLSELQEARRGGNGVQESGPMTWLTVQGL